MRIGVRGGERGGGGEGGGGRGGRGEGGRGGGGGGAEIGRTLGGPVFVAFRPGRNRPNTGGTSVRGFSARPKSAEHWGDQCSWLFGQAEIGRTLGGPVFVAFRPGRNRPNTGGTSVRGFSARPKSAEHWGDQCSWLFGRGRNRPNTGGTSVRGFSARPKSAEHWGDQCSWLFGRGRNRPNTGGTSVRGFSAVAEIGRRFRYI